MSNSWLSSSSAVTVPELTEYVRHEAQPLMAFSQLCEAPTGGALGKNAGDTVNYTFYPNLTTTGGQLDENEDIPEGSLVPVTVSYTLAEFGNSTRFTGKLADLARLPVEDSMVQSLIDDCMKAQNTAAYAQFELSDWIANFSSSGDEFRTDGTAASFSNATNENLTLDNLRFLVNKAELNNIPKFDGESYAIVTGIESADNLEFDDDVKELLRYDSGRAALNGEIGRIKRCRVIVDNHKISKVAVSNVLDKTYLTGADAVIQDYALPPEIRAEDGGMGRFLRVAWYFIAGWQKVYDQTSHSKEHIIRVVAKP